MKTVLFVLAALVVAVILKRGSRARRQSPRADSPSAFTDALETYSDRHRPYGLDTIQTSRLVPARGFGDVTPLPGVTPG